MLKPASHPCGAGYSAGCRVPRRLFYAFVLTISIPGDFWSVCASDHANPA